MEINMAFRHTLLNVGLIVIIILSTATFTKNDTEFNYNVLNGSLIPLHYDVKIKLDSYRNVIFGKCNITIRINRAIENITMKTSEIFNIIKINLINNNDSQIVNILTVSFIHNAFSTQILIIVPLSPGTYVLTIIYVISDERNSFESLFNSYTSDTEKVLNGSSKLIRGNELFPDWNNPVFKPTINISIYHHRNDKLLSNMPIRKKIDDMNNMLWTHFEKSPLISVRGLIIINTGTFLNIVTSDVHIPFEFWCRTEIKDQVQFAEQVVQEVLYFLKERSTKNAQKVYYIVSKDLQYNINMRNIILLREQDVIYNSILDQKSRKIKVANVIAYRTISCWYNDVFLWSKKGFITFLTAHILHETNLIYRMMDLFVVQTLQESLRVDTLTNKNLFYYVKSSTIWRMLYTLTSDKKFWISINTYVGHQYNQSMLKNDTLWNIFQIVLNIDAPHNFIVKHMINIWIMKQYPQIYVERNYSSKITALSYINWRNDIELSTLITYKTKSNEFSSVWLDKLTMFLNSKLFEQNDWIIVNLQQSGRYRVNYNTENWKNLAHYLYYENHNDIHVLNRAQLIDDAFYYFMKRKISFLIFWNVTNFLIKDADYIAWYPMIKIIEYMTCIWSIATTIDVKENIKDMLHALLLHIGYEDDIYEPDFSKSLREEAVKWACVLDAPECRETATFQLINHLKDSVKDKSLKPKEWIYCKGLMKGNNTIWFKVYAKWQRTTDNALLEYLTCSTDLQIIKNYLKLIKTSNFKLQISDKMRANILLLIITKHVKNNLIFELILKQLKFNEFKFLRKVEQIAILIVIITHNHDVVHFQRIKKFIKNNLIVINRDVVDAVEHKINKRKKEYNKQIDKYGQAWIVNFNL